MVRINIALAKPLGQGAPKRAADDISTLLSRLRAQVDDLLGQLESAPLPPKDQASVLSTLARIAPQLVAAEREYKMAVDGRDLTTLTNAQLAELIDRTRAKRER